MLLTFQIWLLTEKLQQLAAKGDAAFSKAQDLIQEAKDLSVNGPLSDNVSLRLIVSQYGCIVSTRLLVQSKNGLLSK